MSNAQKAYASFFDLSAELRNRIYEEVLIDKEDSHSLLLDKSIRHFGFHEDFHPLALLQVNRHVRSETHQMYYAQSRRWQIINHDCDARGLVKLQRLENEVNRFYVGAGGGKIKFDVEVWVYGRHDWSDLMWWCERVQQGVIRSLYGPSVRGLPNVVMGALAVAESHVGGSWKKRERAMLMLRHAFAELDEQWWESDEEESESDDEAGSKDEIESGHGSP